MRVPKLVSLIIRCLLRRYAPQLCPSHRSPQAATTSLRGNVTDPSGAAHRPCECGSLRSGSCLRTIHKDGISRRI